ncbi:V-set and immunoglobulin domain-containing protein 4 isoform X3 [Mauremys mutica]|uniref:V-set and immunoglobulin domain-containing protein 4 isoform X3 n=1 Tax=Mauremys mutica TaxID=74926 RepID=UPI001D16D6DE|nr:V-set and immunoglobulin domain-containing protein 4 isoform X3 [Mauremys mutica]XP_044886076.1 V-set and immunoglobulin domain-containing protein 4 isoform X3 [Mauremys mutica]XP_044886077.1 V-set and immunoglobulin domain-containing protein 4 isoform X3 [Mauremys mutica]XP_044886078.1 V-set and immunoglobulin domain-containing protein 4 isoform X3 [Mauremys mutica]XP_044886079.1 V-set and immunoglobulin domain-containing protein 4 isoform X3 [Mauremys mutica]
MEKLMWLVALVNSFIFCNAILELTGTHDTEGTWKSSITLPCIYGPSQDFVQQTVIWTLVRDQSPATVFRRDSSGDHIMLSRYRGRVSVPKYSPGDVSLEIEKLEITDSGHYTCKVTWRAQNNSLLTKERTTTIKVVKVAVTKPIIRAGNLGFTVPKGARTSLTCSANGSPPITYRWFKGEPGGNTVLVSNHAVLMFDLLRTSDTGKYYCEAENRVSSQVMQQSDAVQLTVRDLTKPATTVPSSENKANTTAKPVSERELITTALAPGSEVRVPETHEVTAGHRRTGLPFYLIILIVVLCVAVVFVVVAVILCRRKTKEDNPYEVTYQNTRNDTRRQTCSGVNDKCKYEEGKPTVKNNFMTQPVKENEYETISIKETNECKSLVNAMESEYEVGDVQ